MHRIDRAHGTARTHHRCTSGRQHTRVHTRRNDRGRCRDRHIRSRRSRTAVGRRRTPLVRRRRRVGSPLADRGSRRACRSRRRRATPRGRSQRHLDRTDTRLDRPRVRAQGRVRGSRRPATAAGCPGPESLGPSYETRASTRRELQGARPRSSTGNRPRSRVAAVRAMRTVYGRRTPGPAQGVTAPAAGSRSRPPCWSRHRAPRPRPPHRRWPPDFPAAGDACRGAMSARTGSRCSSRCDRPR